MIRLFKYHGCGNDFLVAWCIPLSEGRHSAFARSVCDRHRGVGADGCLFVDTEEEGNFPLRIYNCDGSEAGMSGNGIRCAAAFLHHWGHAPSAEVTLDTRAGRRSLTLLHQASDRWSYRADLGRPDFRPAAIPMRLDPLPARVVDFPVTAAGRVVHVTAFSIGNPQCQLFVDEDFGPEDFALLGQALERHAVFPDRANIGFVKVEDRHRLFLRIWERGVGPTLSSGTGSASAAIAAIVNGMAESPLEVRTESGSQTVEWVDGEDVYLSGEAEFVAEARISPNLLKGD